MPVLNKPYASPNDSTAYQALFTLCEKNQVDVEKVKELLWDINAGPELISFIRIITHLQKIIFEAEQCSAIGPNRIKADISWKKELDWLVENSVLLERHCGTLLSFSATKKANDDKSYHPLNRICLGRNALYSMLWNKANAKELKTMFEQSFGSTKPNKKELENIEINLNLFKKQYRLLQWHIFVTHKQSTRLNTNIEDFLSHDDTDVYFSFDIDTLKSACKDVRNLGNGNHWPNLKKLNANRSTYSLFFYLEQKYSANAFSSTIALKTLATKIIQNDWCLRLGSSTTRGSGLKRKSTAFHVEYGDEAAISHEYPDDGEGGRNGAKVRTLKEWNKIEGWSESDLPKEEQADLTHEDNLVSFKCNKKGLVKDQIMSAIGYANKRKILNQHLPIHYNIMTIAEVAECMHTLGEAIRNKSLQNMYQKSALLGILMYWTGNKMDRFSSFTIIHNQTFVPDDIEIAYFLAEKKWRIKVPIYNASIKTTDEENAICRKGGEFLYLPDVWGLDSILKELKEDDAETNDDLVKPFKKKQFKVYRAALKNMFEPLNNHGYRVTLERLSTDLLMRLISAGDAVAGVLITGQEHPSATTERHYSSPSIAYLLKTYLEIANPLLEAIYKERYENQHKDRQAKNHIDTNIGVGAERCPSLLEVKELLNRAQNNIHKAESNKERFEAYTIYTTLLIIYATGYRAVRNINLDETCRDHASESAWISDKDGTDGYHTRRIFLVPELKKQLIEYEHFREKVFAAWELHFPKVPRPNPSETPYLFIVDTEKGKINPVSSASMKEPLLELNFPLPLNSNRRFLRTELIERGCPYDIAQAFMGHWSAGQEPHNPYACLSPIRERTLLKKYLLPILKEIDFKHIVPSFS